MTLNYDDWLKISVVNVSGETKHLAQISWWGRCRKGASLAFAVNKEITGPCGKRLQHHLEHDFVGATTGYPLREEQQLPSEISANRECRTESFAPGETRELLIYPLWHYHLDEPGVYQLRVTISWATAPAFVTESITTDPIDIVVTRQDVEAYQSAWREFAAEKAAYDAAERRRHARP